MKRRYQISKQRAVQQFKGWAQTSNQPIQLAIATEEVAELAQQSLGDLLRIVGKLFIESVMASEVEHRAGRRCRRKAGAQAYRWGTETGYCVIDGQKVPIDRPRVRAKANNKEIPLGSYELFQRASLIGETVWHKIMHGLTMRSYKEVVQQFADAYGLDRSATSEHFVETSRLKLEQLQKRTFQDLNISVMIIDGSIFKGESLVVAIGVDCAGRKLVLGLRQGTTENATVVRDLLGELLERGIDFSAPRLYIIDGSKAIRAAIRSFAGDAAFIQRCQVHKIRNVAEYLPEAQRHAVKFRMRAAYLMAEAADAKNALLRLHDELIEVNPSAAGSLVEGLDETLTVLDLRIPPRLRQSLSSTNGIESSFSLVQRICAQVKRWQGRDHRLRWVASSLLFVESRWNRITGFRYMPLLNQALAEGFRLRMAHFNATRREHVGAA